MTYDIAAIRSHFPALAAGIAHFDGPGGTQTPEPVIRAIADAMAQPLSNRGQVTLGERNAEALVTGARRAMADLLGASPSGIVFGRSATQLTYDVARTLAKTWSPGDEVVVTRLDHDANIRPWVQSGATVRWAEFDPETGELTVDAIRSVLSERTRLVAVTAASNLIGTRPDIPAIARAAHEVGALVHVDGVHHTAHALVDVGALGADFFVCSPYKFLGPHHGVLAARPELLETLRPDKLLPSTDAVPERFELGTLPYEFLAGTTAAVDFLAERLDRRPPAPGGAAERRIRRARSPRTGPARPDRRGARRARRRHRPLPGRRSHPDRPADLREPQHGRRVRLPRGAWRPGPGRCLLRHRGLPAPRPRRHRRPARRARPLQRLSGRRPAPDGTDRLPEEVKERRS